MYEGGVLTGAKVAVGIIGDNRKIAHVHQIHMEHPCHFDLHVKF